MEYNMSLDKQYIIIPSEVMAREVGGEMVILNLESEQYYGLDAVGTDMWAALIKATNIEEALSLLHQDYDVELQELQKDLEEFITKLEKAGLLEVRNL
jgi:ornithine carbamoyltransferase